MRKKCIQLLTLGFSIFNTCVFGILGNGGTASGLNKVENVTIGVLDFAGLAKFAVENKVFTDYRKINIKRMEPLDSGSGSIMKMRAFIER